MEEWQITYAEQKLALANEPPSLRETIDIRARGGSKTWDTMLLSLYLAAKGFTGVWFSSGREQLNQPKKYLHYIINHSFLKSITTEKLKMKVRFKTNGELKLINLTENNARSPRADFVIYDEEALAEEDAYRAAVNILAGSELGMVFHISTPVKASIFEENYERLRRRELLKDIECVFTRSWDEIGFLAKRKEWYEEQRNILPAWYFRQEHECSFELPSGAVFQNVKYGSYPDWLMDSLTDQPLLSGLDWNPVSGHWVASVKFTEDMMNCVVLAEHDIGNGYAIDMTNEQFAVIRNAGTKGNKIVIEEGGINEEYVKWLKKKLTTCGWPEKRFYYEEWDSQGINKLQACTWLIQNGVCIWVDEMRFPTLAKQIEECRWDQDASEPKLAKDPADSPHALDAFLHAISKQNRNPPVYEVANW